MMTPWMMLRPYSGMFSAIGMLTSVMRVIVPAATPT